MTLFLKDGHAALGENLDVVKTSVRIENDTIVNIGPAILPDTADEMIDASRFLILPGFVNAHLHPTHALSKGVADGMTWSAGLKRLYELDVYKNDRDRFWSSLLAYAEAVFCGTTTVSVLTSALEGERAAAEDIGIRAVLSKAYGDIWRGEGRGPRLMTVKEIEKDFERMHREFRSERIDVHIGIGIETAASPQLLSLTKDIAETHRVRVNMHTAEHREVIRDFRGMHGTHPVLYFRDCKFLGPHLTLIHTTQIHRVDVLDALASSGTSIVNCPVANAKLTDGILPLKELRRRHVTVGLGTDASMNNNTNNMLSEMYAAILLHNSRVNDPAFLTARDVLRMATIDSARAIGLDERVGSIEVGKRADFAIFDMDTLAFTPSYDPLSNLIFNGSDIRARHTLVNGKWVVRDYRLQTSSLGEIMREVNERSAKIKEALTRPRSPKRKIKMYIAGAFNHAESASTKDFMRRIGEALRNRGYEPLLPYSIAHPDRVATIPHEEIVEFDVDHVSEADLLIAYVGVPSLGVGMEIMLAYEQQKPVIAVYEKGRAVSRMVLGVVPPERRVEFESLEQALTGIVEKVSEVV